MPIVRRVLVLLALVLLVGSVVFLGLLLFDRPIEEAALIVGLAAAGVGLITALCKAFVWLVRQLRPQKVGRPSTQQVNDLATAVQRQWREEATRRKLDAPAPLPIRWALAPPELGGPAGGAVGSPGQPRRFPVLPELGEVSERMLRSGGGLAELFGVYGGLASGRLVLTGSPGAGKTSAGILLLLEVLKYRDQLPADAQAKVPVPVMFTLADWDPNTTSFEAWLAQKLTEIPMAGRPSTAVTAALVDDGYVAAIVDGLDEINPDLRPSALEALSASRVRLVLLTRSNEMALAAQEHRLIDATVLTLCESNAATAADYLARSLPGQPPTHWDDFLTQLRSEPDGHLAATLRTPLGLTLVRDTYRGGDDIGDLLDAAQTPVAGTVEDHLLDRFIEVAYTPRPGQPAPTYSVAVARRALSFIAGRMTGDGTRDLAWWQIATWAPRTSRVLLGALPVGLAGGLAFGITFTLVAAPFGFWFALGGLAFGFLGGASAGRFFRSTAGKLMRAGRLRWRAFVSPKVLAVGVVIGLLFGVTLPLGDAPAGLMARLMLGLVVGLVVWLAGGLTEGIVREVDLTTPVTPLVAWKADQRAHLIIWIVTALMISVFVIVLGTLPVVESEDFIWGTEDFVLLAILLIFTLTVFPVVGLISSTTFAARITFVKLAISDGLPVRLMRFLEDAHKREVLRTIGPVYQFRHARLQDRLARWQQIDRPNTGQP